MRYKATLFKSLLFAFILVVSVILLVPTCFRAAGLNSPVSRYGFINERGEFVIQPKFEYAKSFKNGKAEIYVYPKPEDDTGHTAYVYYINKKGRIISKRYLTDNFDWTRRFFRRDNGDIKVVSLPEWTEGLLPQRSYDGRGLWGFKDQNGTWVIQPKYNYVTSFKNGIAFVNIDQKGDDDFHTGIWGAIDKNGNWIMQPTCVGLYKFSDGLALCRVEI